MRHTLRRSILSSRRNRDFNSADKFIQPLRFGNRLNNSLQARKNKDSERRLSANASPTTSQCQHQRTSLITSMISTRRRIISAMSLTDRRQSRQRNRVTIHSNHHRKSNYNTLKISISPLLVTNNPHRLISLILHSLVPKAITRILTNHYK